MTLTPQQIQILEAPLDPACVKKGGGNFGPKGDYLEGWHVINELNRVFGFDGWSYSVDLTRDALAEVEVEKNGQKSMQWQAAYTCICTLTAAGASRQDVGFGSGFAKGIGDAIEGATKEATTDALKRCARTFGNIFGLALYDKSRANVQAPAPVAAPKITDEQRVELMGLLDATNVPVAEMLKAAKITDLRDVLASEFENGKKWINKRARELQAAQAKVDA
jgi:DNA repair and recombination protein RAD52